MLAGMIGTDATIQAIRAQVARLVSAERLPAVLIHGETGTGKTLLARELHAESSRARAPFVNINCAAIPEGLLESELFGIERGAFTDARDSRPGLLRTAHQGTLFLDEIGHLPLRLQPKLLTVLEEWQVRRIGATRSEPIDVWLISATSEDLERAIAEQRFLRALYHRLAVMTFRVPALRERAADVPRIAEQLLAGVCRTYGLGRKRLAADADTELRRYAWPGNVRELGNVIERAALLADGVEVTATMLDLPAAAPGGESAATGVARYTHRTEDERTVLKRALADCQGNVSEAARLLAIPRNTLRYRLQRHGLLAPAAPEPRESAPSVPPPGAVAPLRWESSTLRF